MAEDTVVDLGVVVEVDHIEVPAQITGLVLVEIIVVQVVEEEAVTAVQEIILQVVADILMKIPVLVTDSHHQGIPIDMMIIKDHIE